MGETMDLSKCKAQEAATDGREQTVICSSKEPNQKKAHKWDRL
jgi:hypothetical protein